MGEGSSEKPGGAERRAAVRHFTCYPFHVQTGESGDTSDMAIAVIQDLSPTGALLLVGSDLPIGTRVKLHLDFVEPSPRIVEGRVVRAERRPRDASAVWPFGAAVEFSEACEDLAPSIEELARKVGSES